MKWPQDAVEKRDAVAKSPLLRLRLVADATVAPLRMLCHLLS